MESVDPIVILKKEMSHNLTFEEEEALLQDDSEPKPSNLATVIPEGQPETRLVRGPRPMCIGPENNKKRGKRGKRTGQRRTKSREKASQSSEADADINTKPTAKPKKSDDLDTKLNNQAKTAPIVNRHQMSSNDGFSSAKRQRSAGNSPNTEQPRKQRKFAEVVADDLRVMIVDNAKSMNVEEAGLVEASLHYLMDEHITKGPNKCPTFHDLRYVGGNLRLICADVFAKQWIETAIRKMNPPWEGAKLELVPVPPKVQRPTIRFFIPNGLKKPEFADILIKFRRQNPPLSTAQWTAWKRDVKEEGVFYHVSVEPVTVTLIESMGNRLFFYFSKIKIITPPKKPLEEVKVQVEDEVINVTNEDGNKDDTVST